MWPLEETPYPYFVAMERSLDLGQCARNVDDIPALLARQTPFGITSMVADRA